MPNVGQRATKEATHVLPTAPFGRPKRAPQTIACVSRRCVVLLASNHVVLSHVVKTSVKKLSQRRRARRQPLNSMCWYYLPSTRPSKATASTLTRVATRACCWCRRFLLLPARRWPPTPGWVGRGRSAPPGQAGRSVPGRHRHRPAIMSPWRIA